MIASRKNTLATAFVSACNVAVRLSGVPDEIVSQSRNPVRTVASEVIAPTTSASHQACANPCSATPSLLRTAAIAAKVYAPIVASVSGGCDGCPGNPRSEFIGPRFTAAGDAKTWRAGLRRRRVVEVRQEREVLGEIRLDRRHAGPRPLLDPRGAEVVLDPVECATFVHVVDDRPRGRSAHEPFGLSSRPAAPIAWGARGGLPDRQPALGRRVGNRRPAGGGGGARRPGARARRGRRPGRSRSVGARRPARNGGRRRLAGARRGGVPGAGRAVRN